jgi:hypothetical protein
LWNNWLSLLCYIVIGIVVYLLDSLSSFNQGLLWNLVVSIPILIATPILFILVGRYALKSQGSSIKDLVSVLLVCVIGFLLTPGMAYFKQHNAGDFSFGSLYFLYEAPLDVLNLFFKNNSSSWWDPLMVGKGVPGLLSGGFFSFIPTLLMWIGLRWQSRSHPSL